MNMVRQLMCSKKQQSWLGNMQALSFKEKPFPEKVEKNGAPTVKSATQLIDENISNLRAGSFSNLLWKGWMPLKMDVFH